MGQNSSSEPPQQAPTYQQSATMNMLYNSNRPTSMSAYYQFQNTQRPTSSQTSAVPLKLKAAINKSSIQLNPDQNSSKGYFVNFEYSSEEDCQITVYFFAQENLDAQNNPSYYVDTTKFPSPQTLYLKPGTNQKIVNQIYLDISSYSLELLFHYDKRLYPIVIVIQPLSIETHQFLTTYLSFTRISDRLSLKVIRQKASIGGQDHELLEMFGMPNINQESNECIICLTETKNTAIIPCRHVCLCKFCAQMMQSQTNQNNCPICRGPVTSFLSINNNGS